MRAPSEVLPVMGWKLPARAVLISWERVGGLATEAKGGETGTGTG